MKIYVASKVRHAAKWLKMRTNGLPISSTWIDEAGEGASPSLESLAIRCIEEARDADAVLFYTSKDDDAQKGSLLEVGAALGALRPILIVGDGLGLGKTFSYHPLVEQNREIDEAFGWAERDLMGPLMRAVQRIIESSSARSRRFTPVSSDPTRTEEPTP